MAKEWFQTKVVDNIKSIPNPFSSKQAQSQMQVDNQMQATITTQTMIEQVDDTIETIALTAEMFQDQQVAEKTINRMSDSAILSLNMLAVSCEELYKEKDDETIALAKKRAYDKLSELKSENKVVYELIEPHRNFINAALNGQRNLRYKSSRVRDGPTLFQNGVKSINDAFAKIIHSNQDFEKHQEAMRNPDTNQKLAAQHQSQLNEYHNNDKYKQEQHQSKDRPKQSDLYFTKSGKTSKFIDKRAVAQNDAAKQAMDEDVYGPEPDVYDELLPNIKFKNAVLKLSDKMQWNDISNPIPCLILIPNKEQRAKQDKSRIGVVPCFPYNNVVLDVKPYLLEIDTAVVKKYEEAHIESLQRRKKVPGPVGLGYPTVEEQEKEQQQEIDIDDLLE